MVKGDFQYYMWLLRLLSHGDKYTLADINSAFSRSGLWGDYECKNISDRTFRNWRTKIESMFSISILCNGYNEYFIANPSEAETSCLNSLISTLNAVKSITENPNLLGFISTMKSNSEGFCLYSVISALEKGERINILYNKVDIRLGIKQISGLKYDTPCSFAPYQLKVLFNRWFVIGNLYALSDSQKQYLVAYALDDMKLADEVESGESYVIPEGFNFNRYLQDRFGIEPNSETHLDPTDIIMTVANRNGLANSLRKNPLNATQIEIDDSRVLSKFKVSVVPNADLATLVLAYGGKIRSVRLSNDNEKNQELEKLVRMRRVWFNGIPTDSFEEGC